MIHPSPFLRFTKEQLANDINRGGLNSYDMYGIAKLEVFKELTMDDLCIDRTDTAGETTCRFYDCPAGGTFSLHEKVIIRSAVTEANRYTRILHRVCERYRQLQPNLPQTFVDVPFVAPDHRTLRRIWNMHERFTHSDHCLSIVDTRTRHNCIRYGHDRHYLLQPEHVQRREEYRAAFLAQHGLDYGTPKVADRFPHEGSIASMTMPLLPPMMGFVTGADLVTMGVVGSVGSVEEYEDSFLPRRVSSVNRGCTNFSKDPAINPANDYFAGIIRIGNDLLHPCLTRQDRARRIFIFLYNQIFFRVQSHRLNAKELFSDVMESADSYMQWPDVNSLASEPGYGSNPDSDSESESESTQF